MSSHPTIASALPRVFCLVGPDDDLSLLPVLAARGVTGFQVRDKTGDDRDCLALVVAVRAALAPHDAMVLVDDRLDVALVAGADGVHAGLGPIRASDSKAGLPDPLGAMAVRAASGALPVIAIGGIDAPTAREVRTAGAHGVAVIGALWRARDPLRAAEELVAAVA